MCANTLGGRPCECSGRCLTAAEATERGSEGTHNGLPGPGAVGSGAGSVPTGRCTALSAATARANAADASSVARRGGDDAGGGGVRTGRAERASGWAVNAGATNQDGAAALDAAVHVVAVVVLAGTAEEAETGEDGIGETAAGAAVDGSAAHDVCGGGGGGGSWGGGIVACARGRRR